MNEPDNSGTNMFVTIAARVCDDYGDITANRQRNNLQESLRNLGPNTLYDGDDYVNPADELTMQPNCRPLAGFKFTFGENFNGPKSIGPWGSLSQVGNPFATDITTVASVPDRDKNGKIKADGSTVPGAITMEITEAEKKSP